MDQFYSAIDWKFSQVMSGLQIHTNSIQRKMDEKFGSLDEMIGQFATELLKTKETTEQNRNDIETLKKYTDRVLDRLDKLETGAEFLDKDWRKNNLMFFGVPETENGNFRLVDQITDLLNDCSSRRHEWHEDDFETAYRIGKMTHMRRQQSRPILVRFLRRRDKVETLSDRSLRDCLRRQGIRISADMTDKQREQIKHYRDQGLQAFFRNGRLQIQERRTYHSVESGQNQAQRNYSQYVDRSERASRNSQHRSRKENQRFHEHRKTDYHLNKSVRENRVLDPTSSNQDDVDYRMSRHCQQPNHMAYGSGYVPDCGDDWRQDNYYINVQMGNRDRMEASESLHNGHRRDNENDVHQKSVISDVSNLINIPTNQHIAPGDKLYSEAVKTPINSALHSQDELLTDAHEVDIIPNMTANPGPSPSINLNEPPSYPSNSENVSEENEMPTTVSNNEFSDQVNIDNNAAIPYDGKDALHNSTEELNSDNNDDEEAVSELDSRLSSTSIHHPDIHKLCSTCPNNTAPEKQVTAVHSRGHHSADKDIPITADSPLITASDKAMTPREHRSEQRNRSCPGPVTRSKSLSSVRQSKDKQASLPSSWFKTSVPKPQDSNQEIQPVERETR